MVQPFVSKKQHRLCWVLYNKAVNNGRIPSWNCPAAAAISPPYNTLPLYLHGTGPGVRWRLVPVYTGPRGGRYILKHGNKIYINK